VAGCGINGRPLSPSEASSLGKKETLFPLNSSDSDASQEAPQVQSQSYVRRNDLEQRGSNYSANFGLHNDTLNDIFERIKPKSAILKKR
jgi:hypothetical protein